ncbi:MAG: saccharopine dehydrogenase family protein [Burkholderiales bacterium]
MSAPPRTRARRRAGGAAAAREFDIVVYGASGFVGRQAVAHLAAHAGSLRWALAGRSQAKLEAVRQACGPGAAAAGIVVAVADDAPALAALAARARVVLSTAGPFARYGDALVDACVAHRTHYVDITGETPWVRRLIDRHHERAAADGTRIVPCCGFDSVPSDLGAWLVAQALWRDHGEACVEVKARFALRGGVNGGTLASALGMFDAGDQDAFDDPFLLTPADRVPADTLRHLDPRLPRRDADFGGWIGPFFMGPVNTRVVRRSAALLAAAGDPAYAPGFAYQEWLKLGQGPAAAAAGGAMAVGAGVARVALAAPSVRALARRLLPAPGEGPSERSMDRGRFRCELVGRGARGTVVRGLVAGRGDPGNRATTVFVCEAALALATQADALPATVSGGVLTPATAFGEVLARRLLDAGMEIRPVSGDDRSSAY